MRTQELVELAQRGVYIPATAEYVGGEQSHVAAVVNAWKSNIGLAMDAYPDMFGGASDAQPQLVTTPNTGIPFFLANLIDPEVIRVVFAPMRGAQIWGEQKKGDWTMLSTQFPIVENTGEVSSYGDWNNNGSTGANVNFVPRQSYHYQTITQYGERELDMYGLAKINYKSELDTSAALVLAKFQNLSYFFGIGGLQNYGALNDPSLIAPITPSTKAATGVTWAVGTANEIYSDAVLLYAKLLTQMGNNIDKNEPMTLVMSPGAEVNMLKTNEFGINVTDLLKKNFPNLEIMTAPEYSTTGGELMQLILKNVDGVNTAYGAFTEKLRTHAVVQGLSNFMQKKSAGTWGWIGRRPIAIAQMLGM